MTLKQIKKRIDKLNNIIDKKIVMGESYKKESNEHKNWLYFLKDVQQN